MRTKSANPFRGKTKPKPSARFIGYASTKIPLNPASRPPNNSLTKKLSRRTPVLMHWPSVYSVLLRSLRISLIRQLREREMKRKRTTLSSKVKRKKSMRHLRVVVLRPRQSYRPLPSDEVIALSFYQNSSRLLPTLLLPTPRLASVRIAAASGNEQSITITTKTPLRWPELLLNRSYWTGFV